MVLLWTTLGFPSRPFPTRRSRQWIQLDRCILNWIQSSISIGCLCISTLRMNKTTHAVVITWSTLPLMSYNKQGVLIFVDTDEYCTHNVYLFVLWLVMSLFVRIPRSQTKKTYSYARRVAQKINQVTTVRYTHLHTYTYMHAYVY